MAPELIVTEHKRRELRITTKCRVVYYLTDKDGQIIDWSFSKDYIKNIKKCLEFAGE